MIPISKIKNNSNHRGDCSKSGTPNLQSTKDLAVVLMYAENVVMTKHILYYTIFAKNITFDIQDQYYTSKT